MLPLSRPTTRFSCLATGLLLIGALASDAALATASYDVDATTGFRMERYRGPVPDSVPGGITLDTAAMRVAFDNDALVMIDVFPPKGLGPDPLDGRWIISEGHDTLPGATWLPDVGRGFIEPALEAYFRRNLDRLADGDPSTPVVFFCTADCWQSWNASKRAADWGYTAVHWYPLGTDGWVENGGSLVPARPLNFISDEPDPIADRARPVEAIDTGSPVDPTLQPLDLGEFVDDENHPRRFLTLLSRP